MTRHLDPDRPTPRFWPFPIDIDTSVCSRCSAMVPATDKAQELHRDDHRERDDLAAGFASVALANQLSGSGSRGDTSVGWHRADASPDPDVKSPPTPPQDTTSRGEAEGSNQGTEADAAAGTSLGDVTPDPAAYPRAAGSAQRVGRGSDDVGVSTVSAPADTTRSRPAEGLGTNPGRLLSLAPPPDHGKWTR